MNEVAREVMGSSTRLEVVSTEEDSVGAIMGVETPASISCSIGITGTTGLTTLAGVEKLGIVTVSAAEYEGS